MPVDLLQDGAVTLVAIAAVVLIVRRYLGSTVNDATPKCSNCASACDGPVPQSPTQSAPVAHPVNFVRRAPK